MAADWITEGLHRTGAVNVVPTPTMLAVVRARVPGDTADPLRALAKQTGASLVLTGTIYRDRDRLVFKRSWRILPQEDLSERSSR